MFVADVLIGRYIHLFHQLADIQIHAITSDPPSRWQVIEHNVAEARDAAPGQSRRVSLQTLPLEILLHILHFVAPPSLCALAAASRKLRRIADSNYVWRDYANRHFGLPQSEWSKFGAPYSGLRKLQESEFVRHVEQSIIRLLPRALGFTEALAEFRRNPDETTAGHDFHIQIQSLVAHVSSKYEKPTEEWRRRSDEEYAAKRDWKAYYRQCYSLLISKAGVKYVTGAHLSGGHRDSIYCLHSRSPDSDIVFSADEDGTIIVWDIERSKQIRTLRGCHKGAIFSICTLPHPSEECLLLTGGGDGRIVLLDWTRAGVDFSLRAMSVSHADAVSSLSFCSETRMVCSGSADDTVLGTPLFILSVDIRVLT